MIDYYWRTQNTGYRYVDSDTGDDITGDGTQQKPYQTLGRAWRSSTSKPGTILCRGRFSEDMADGNHSCTIMGDYPGAATFDGGNEYTLYGFTITNLIVINCLPGSPEMTVQTNTPYLAGVGRADGASYVGRTYADHLGGLAGSGGIVGQSGHYFGMVGGAGSSNCIFNPKRNDTYKLWIHAYNFPMNWCIHGVKIEDRQVTRSSNTSNGFRTSIFTDVAFVSTDRIKFTDCVFGSDCTWWKSNLTEQIIPEGETSEEKIKDLEAKLLQDTATPCTFVNCLFLDKTANEIFNDPDKGDFTIKLDSGVPAGRGARGFAVKVPIMDDSTGVPGTWDEKTAEGLLKVEDNQIVIDSDSLDDEGSIQSKIVIFDTSQYTMKGIVSLLTSKFQDMYVQYWDKTNLGATFDVGQQLPQSTKFKVLEGPVKYNGNTYNTNDIITTGTTNITLEEADEDPAENGQVIELLSCNIKNCCYARVSPSVYSIVDVSAVQELNPETTYLNVGKVDVVVTHKDKGSYTLKPNESIVGITTNEATPNGLLAPMFDNDEVPKTDWIPSQLLGDSLTILDNGSILKDTEGVAIGTGNINYWKSYQGRVGQRFTYKYIQFKFEVRK